MSFTLGNAKAPPALANAAGRIPGVVAGRSKEKTDFSQMLTDENLEDLTTHFLTGEGGDGMMDSLGSVVSQRKLDAMRANDKPPFGETIWSPPLCVTRSVIHAVGVQKSKYPEQNVASRYYFFQCSTAIPKHIVAKINVDNQEKDPDYDLKKQHVFFNDQMKKAIDKFIQQAWENDDFAKCWRDHRLDLYLNEKTEAMMKDWEAQRNAGTITNDEYNKLSRPIKMKTFKFKDLPAEDQKKFMDQLFVEYKRSVRIPMKEDDDIPDVDPDAINAPKEYVYDFKMKIFKKPSGVLEKLKAVPPDAVDTEFEKLKAQKVQEYAAAGKTFVLDAKIQKELTAIATRSLCEAKGYKYVQVSFLSKHSKAKATKAPSFLTPMCYSGFIVRVGFSFSLFATKGTDGKLGIKLQAIPKVQILEPIKPKRIEDAPEESEYGSEWTYESIHAMVTRRDDDDDDEEQKTLPPALTQQTIPAQLAGQKRSATSAGVPPPAYQPSAKRVQTQNGSADPQQHQEEIETNGSPYYAPGTDE